jgi:tRNA A37 threonylcarbamoyladenosine synthetase subunit TsaC/SUA5/YrdC
MLPYSPLHYLLLQQFDTPLVLTSGNQSHHPQIIGNQQALTAELISAKQAKWNPPIPLIAIIFPCFNSVAVLAIILSVAIS